MNETLFLQALSLAKAGRKSEARGLLQEILQEDRQNEMAWLWYAECAESIPDRIQILETCVRTNPQANQAWLLLTELRRANAASQPPEQAAPTQPVRSYRYGREQPTGQEPCQEDWKETNGAEVFTVSPDCLSSDEFTRAEEHAAEALKKKPARDEIDWLKLQRGSRPPHSRYNKDGKKGLFSKFFFAG